MSTSIERGKLDPTSTIPLARSRAIRARAHALIPGGCHTYAKGDDQYPECAPGFIQHGSGCHVWDVDGNEYIEYGMGGRAVVLGHVFPAVNEAVKSMLGNGASFTRPHIAEVACAEKFLSMIQRADMVKFTKDGSTATTAALRLARAHTGRDLIALCSDHPFFSYDDWFISTTDMDAGIPPVVASLTRTFRYNDIEGCRTLFAECGDRLAAVILEPIRDVEPREGFLHELRRLCHENGTVFILDETITGFRFHNGGAQEIFDLTPDLAIFGKGLSNGFALSALCGRRELMERGGLYHERERVFLLSTTHGAETHALAATMAVIDTYREQPVVSHLWNIGEYLRRSCEEVIRNHGLEPYIQIDGFAPNLVFVTRDHDGNPSQGMRSLFLQEMIRNGILGPSFVVSYAHTRADVNATADALNNVLPTYRAALEDGHESFLVGAPSKVVYRRFN